VTGGAAPEAGLPLEVENGRGRRLTIRRATPDDAPALADLYAGLPLEDAHRRFFTGGCPPEDWITRWLSPPGEVVVAVDESGAVVADAGYAVDAAGRAELGMLVERSHRGWLGPYLLDVVLRLAAAAGHDAVVAEVLATNRPMLGLAAARGYVLLPCDDLATVRLVLGTHGTVPGWPGTRDKPRVLVETPGGRSAVVADLAAAGFDVVACPGPNRRTPRWRCPALEGRRCPLVEAADAILVRLRADGDGEAAVAAAHAVVHAGVPVIDPGHDVVAAAREATGTGAAEGEHEDRAEDAEG